MRRRRPALRPYSGQDYYGQPPLKAPHWDWKVSGYIVLAGVAGAAQSVAWIAGLRDRAGYRGALRNARLLALGASGTGAALLVADLKTPGRFYNMLRILRPTSPMSLGSYVLSLFGAASAAAALGELPAARRSARLTRTADAAQAAAAVSGAGAATYTAALLAATSNPYWAAAPRELGTQFATSSVAGGAAALALAERAGGRRRTARRLEELAALASLAHLAASRAARRRRRAAGIADALDDEPERIRLETADLLLAGALPLAGYALDRLSGGRAPVAAVAGSLALLVGGFLVRDGILRTGKAAAHRPEAAFRAAQPDRLEAAPRRRIGEPR